MSLTRPGSGLEDGVARSWYRRSEGGKLSQEIANRRGVFHGPYRTYYPDGKPQVSETVNYVLRNAPCEVMLLRVNGECIP